MQTPGVGEGAGSFPLTPRWARTWIGITAAPGAGGTGIALHRLNHQREAGVYPTGTDTDCPGTGQIHLKRHRVAPGRGVIWAGKVGAAIFTAVLETQLQRSEDIH